MTANQIAYWNYVESERHNRATESEQLRSNREREKETHRYNTQQEMLQQERNALQGHLNTINAFYQSKQLAEQQRHNIATEQYQIRSSALEQSRIDLGYAQLANQSSIAAMQNALGYGQLGATYASIAENSRSNIAREAETQRSNLAAEANAARNVSVSRLNAKSQAVNAQANLLRSQLESTKWNDPYSVAARRQGLAAAVDTHNLINSQINLNQAKTSESKIGAASKIMESTSRLAKDIISIGSMIGGKK